MLFKLSEQETFLKKFEIKTNNDIFFIIWTTTPWTLPANQAIAVGNKIEYVLANIGDKSIIVAKDLLELY